MTSLGSTGRRALWAAWVVAALLALDVLDLTVYGVVVPVTALALAVLVPGGLPRSRHVFDRQDVVAVAVLYAGVVVAFRLAFTVFTTDNLLGLFLCFALGLTLGVVGPVVYTVWIRHRALADLGLRLDNWRPAVGLGLVFAFVQFALTLWGYDWPEPVDWVPLLVMSVVVGLFEAVFFRGFVQSRLEAGFGTVPGVAATAALYAAYHVGYGMPPSEMVFLFGLGVVYAVAFTLVRNILVLWPLLTPLGALFNNLEAGDIDLPWASIAGFADVLAVMGLAVWLGHRHERKMLQRIGEGDSEPHSVGA